MPADPKDILRLNYIPLLKEIKQDLERWDCGSFSWFGHKNILKMNTVLRILYVPQALPVKIPNSYFTNLERIFKKFIWAGRTARIAQSTLRCQKKQGGIALPDMRTYYKAIMGLRVSDWQRHSEYKLWIESEQIQAEGNLEEYFWSKTVIPGGLKEHPLIGNTLRVAQHLFEEGNHHFIITVFPSALNGE